MTGFWKGVAISVVTGAVVNELSDLAPWMASRVVRRAAALWTWSDPQSRATQMEEWEAVIDARPGKLLKLVTASWFLVGAVLAAPHRRIRMARRQRHPLPPVDLAVKQLRGRYVHASKPFLAAGFLAAAMMFHSDLLRSDPKTAAAGIPLAACAMLVLLSALIKQLLLTATYLAAMDRILTQASSQARPPRPPQPSRPRRRQPPRRRQQRLPRR